MAAHRSIGEYSPGAEEWPVYTEQLGHYFAANDLDMEAKKKAIHLSLCGLSTYGLTVRQCHRREMNFIQVPRGEDYQILQSCSQKTVHFKDGLEALGIAMLTQRHHWQRGSCS